MINKLWVPSSAAEAIGLLEEGLDSALITFFRGLLFESLQFFTAEWTRGRQSDLPFRFNDGFYDAAGSSDSDAMRLSADHSDLFDILSPMEKDDAMQDLRSM